LDRAQGNSISLWLAGLPENADFNNVVVRLGTRRLQITWMETPNSGESRQVNVEAPEDTQPGMAQIVVEVAGFRTEPADLLII
jgi:hypothetical protein